MTHTPQRARLETASHNHGDISLNVFPKYVTSNTLFYFISCYHLHFRAARNSVKTELISKLGAIAEEQEIVHVHVIVGLCLCEELVLMHS